MKSRIALAVSGFFAGICNGLFGAGGGMLVVPCLEKQVGLPAKKAHSTAVLVIAPLALVSIFRYIGFAHTDTRIITVTCAGGVIGSIFSSLFMKKINTGVLKKIFGVFIIAAAVRMVVL